MNAKAKQIMEFLDRHPELKGKVVGYKASRGGIGITRIDNDWYECDRYLLQMDDAVIAQMDAQLQNSSS